MNNNSFYCLFIRESVMSSPAVLALPDGTLFNGINVGAENCAIGEVVFNTAQTGYQEILTDPSYAEQIIVFTHPHIGNVGTNSQDMESQKVQASGAVMRSFSTFTSSWRSESSLSDFFKAHHLVAISEVDTRALTHHIRKYGIQTGCIGTGQIDTAEIIHYAQQTHSLKGKQLATKNSTPQPYAWKSATKEKPHIVVYDFGLKLSILKYLASYPCSITVIPASTPAYEVLALHPDGIVLSNGPGDPAACQDIIQNIQALLTQQIPTLGICLGHQLLALASGARTEKMNFGHHGANHPIQSQETLTVFISSQNHGFTVSEQPLPDCLKVTHRSLFDGSIAGLKRVDTPAFGFQGHPEAGPGPSDMAYCFQDFMTLVEVFHAKTY